MDLMAELTPTNRDLEDSTGSAPGLGVKLRRAVGEERKSRIKIKSKSKSKNGDRHTPLQGVRPSGPA